MITHQDQLQSYNLVPRILCAQTLFVMTSKDQNVTAFSANYPGATPTTSGQNGSALDRPPINPLKGP